MTLKAGPRIGRRLHAAEPQMTAFRSAEVRQAAACFGCTAAGLRRAGGCPCLGSRGDRVAVKKGTGCFAQHVLRLAPDRASVFVCCEVASPVRAPPQHRAARLLVYGVVEYVK